MKNSMVIEVPRPKRMPLSEGLYVETTINAGTVATPPWREPCTSLSIRPLFRPTGRLVEVNGKDSVRIVKTDDKGQEIHVHAQGGRRDTSTGADLENLLSPPRKPAPAATPKPDWKA